MTLYIGDYRSRTNGGTARAVQINGTGHQAREISHWLGAPTEFRRGTLRLTERSDVAYGEPGWVVVVTQDRVSIMSPAALALQYERVPSTDGAIQHVGSSTHASALRTWVETGIYRAPGVTTRDHATFELELDGEAVRVEPGDWVVQRAGRFSVQRDAPLESGEASR